ncbi:hypothetical protein BESB_075990 [Besnoitia besnoiti]|uniref:Uncharacterized protein n=1 Tax=Besnoitia besnoiti TaxID=94643 RepID=A0A2A9MDD8_BESBE|nr:hypothetical protein BESB_075990 [Besnoitia besnoiti]PFH33382.1 hypothetical protein BESB_075990 [Besnoitia besnoiti]
MDCCGLCADDDRDVWMADRISPKIGLSDDDLLDFHSDNEMPAPAAQREPAPSYRSIHSRQAPPVAATLPETAHRPNVQTGHLQSQQTFRSTGDGTSLSRSFGASKASIGRLERHPSVTKPASRSASLVRAGSKGRQAPSPARVPSRTNASDGDHSPQPAPATPRRREGSIGNGKAPVKLSELTPEEKEEEKKRLQALVKEFAKEAVAGFPIDRIDEDTGARAQVVFSMDRFITTIDLHSEDESVVPNMSLAMEDLTGIFKGDDAAAHSPVSAGLNRSRLLVLTSSDSPTAVLEASTRHQRDKAYTCLKILSQAKGIAIRLHRLYSAMKQQKEADVQQLEEELAAYSQLSREQELELEHYRRALEEKAAEVERLQKCLILQEGKLQQLSEGGNLEETLSG